jgi:hypothetical protein
MELILSSYRQLYQKRKDFKVQRQLIDSFVTRIKTRVEQLCDQIIEQYSKMEETIDRHNELKGDLKNLDQMY